ncbi:MAG: hypothetical protein Tsb0013_23980 [Phycisphaerales bacterium]
MRNESNADRAVRAIAGIALLLVAFLALDVTAGALWGIVAAIVGAVLLVTGAVGFCPAYRLVGLSTCKVKQA